MAYTLVGSKTSPFVRRIRMLMEGMSYEFKELNIFETDDAITLNKINPVNQVPVLLDGEQPIWDSRQIFNYINLQHKLHQMQWQDENMLTAIEGAMNSAVSLLLMKRSNMNTDEPYMFINRQKERIESVLTYVKPYLENEGLKEWNFITMTLYCFIDWAKFRNLVNFDSRPECVNFLAKYAEKDIVIQTAIPKV